MNPDLHREITRRLLADYAFRERGDWLREGRCPECGERELYAAAEAPWVLRCGRLNKCAWQGHVKDLYPDLFDDWSKRYRASHENPTAAADAYLSQARGFDLSRLRGLYSQESYHDAERGIASATVRFPLACGSYWERLIDRPQRFGKQKARFAPGKSHAGHWWAMPQRDLTTAEAVWLVEGIFDAIALEHHGVPAVALLSCNNYPEHALAALAKACAGRRPALVWALDSDDAGRRYLRKWVERARAAGWHCEAAQIPQQGKGKTDWNDLHLTGRLSPQDREEYLHEGALLIARSAAAKALLIHRRRGWREFPFEHGQRLYWFGLDLGKYSKAREALEIEDSGLTEEEISERAIQESGTVTEIANCFPQALYHQANPLTDEAWYYFRVTFPHRGAAVKGTFTGAQIAAASEFKKRLLHLAPGALFSGSTAQLDRLIREQTFAIKRVATVDFIGYSREHGVYVFGDLAVKDGTIHELNDEDFFDIGKLSIKTLAQSVALSINPNREDYRTDWAGLLWQCFGAKGLVALAYWLGALFAEQIRAEHKSYPFLEVVGEAGSGKSTLIEFLWKLVGRRDYEGFDPSKSTLAARARNFAQVSNLPVVLIESDREDTGAAGRPVKSFDWDELKTAYNGRSVRARGLKNSGNETYEPPFRGAIVIAQNAPVNASEAILQRIVHLHFDRGSHTPDTRRAAECLERMPMEQVSGFVLAATRREARVMQVVTERTLHHEQQLQALPAIKSMRIAKNHAQLMALVEALAEVIRLPEEQVAAAHDHIRSMAVARQQAINADHPLVEEFWETFDFLDSAERIDHSRDPKLIAVNLNHYAEAAAARRQAIPPLVELKRHLRTSRRRKFLDIRAVNSALVSKTVKCWVFEIAPERKE
ncbi:MAG: hypothetical protein KatS3mg128_0068 [Silanimonas sp.]|nr:MAG: hypothetical protein KatS3mg128_0068 [Silanimonas sp.]